MAEVIFQAEWRRSAMVRGGSKGYMGSNVSGVLIKNEGELQNALAAFGDKAVEEGGKALYRMGEQIMAESKRRVPVDTGNLRDSGHVQNPVRQDQSVTVVLGYGGPGIGYALPVHERFDVRHKVGGPKYLEQPVLIFAGQMEAILARDLRVELARVS
jgi:hypothetical protein